MKVLAFSVSVRKDSLNRKLIRIAAEIARNQGATVDLVDFREFDMPLYDGDLEAAGKIPGGARGFQKRLEGVDALLIAMPEYNHSTPGTFKNAIDWLSRIKPVPLAGKSAFLMSASPSPFGGLRGLMAVRPTLQTLGVHVRYHTFCLARANEAFDDRGNFVDSQNDRVLEEMLEAFFQEAEVFKTG